MQRTLLSAVKIIYNFMQPIEYYTEYFYEHPEFESSPITNLYECKTFEVNSLYKFVTFVV